MRSREHEPRAALPVTRAGLPGWCYRVTRRSRLRTKFLFSLVLVSAMLTGSTLLVVRQRVQSQARNEIREALENSLITFRQFQRQRESSLEASAALLAHLPLLEALMTSGDAPTIQDGSTQLWQIAGGDLLVLADRSGKLMALHAVNASLSPPKAQEMLSRSLHYGELQDWWFAGGHLFQVFMQPIYFGEPANRAPLGVLVIGSEINRMVAEDVRRVAASQVAFRYGGRVVVSTLSHSRQQALENMPLAQSPADARPVEIDLEQERFLATSADLRPGSSLNVSLVVLKSYDQATLFLRRLNRWLVVLGLIALSVGSLVVFLISDTFTRPLANLVGGVHALEKGDFEYPLEARGHDEVSELTQSFDRMRHRVREAQQELLEAERFATIGRMASTISHDLRHSLTAILAYAEFLAEGHLAEDRRSEFYHEIRLAVNQMTNQLRELLEFSKARVVHRPALSNIAEVVDRAVRTVKARPEFSGVNVRTTFDGESEAWFDPSGMERVFHNLVLNACEAGTPECTRVEVTTCGTAEGLTIRITDNGRGIPEEIRDRLFQPFVTAGKDNGIGLGLAVVQKIVHEHGGQIHVERTGRDGTVLRLWLPAASPTLSVATRPAGLLPPS